MDTLHETLGMPALPIYNDGTILDMPVPAENAGSDNRRGPKRKTILQV